MIARKQMITYTKRSIISIIKSRARIEGSKVYPSV